MVVVVAKILTSILGGCIPFVYVVSDEGPEILLSTDSGRPALVCRSSRRF